MEDEVAAAITAFKQGLPVCLFDADHREGETDLLFSAQHTTPQTMRTLRKECGGLLFLAIGDEVGDLFGLPFLQDIYTNHELIEKYPTLQHLITNDLQYDSRSAFTLSLNHRDTFTGITDRDRALTTRRFAELYIECQTKTHEYSRERLGEEFRTPGHIPVCRESKGGLTTRQGHTELAVGLARLAGVSPVVIGAEMLQPDGDYALSVEDAKMWASKRNIPFLTGEELIREVD
ncbi:MAG: 3,4-dihydroxy-2-butanone-4-phosphate synthase [Euryarchaeota archaeon]|nr:3,4-dihydroxy-2-butanone-4-phosphate synthase [Euryarchaeota archaeon]DAC16035.1 MAG TPA: 3,4-dihydroxy-2-butanone-4-phosphate synthase [Candidatus Poseidoniales archaeon]HII63111.1 3,4-dihydroxy-2-butanone-4-phosphate synthase [Candidatus Poseidoniaceae archaeon]|tara:strand:+ start:3217 stop:3915 length:699 start_codon:yes stop_codon:yes gene_type:complete